MANQGSAGAGFAKGITRGFNIVSGMRQQKELKQQAEAEKIAESIKDSRDQTLEMAKMIQEQAVIAVKSGADQEQVQAFADAHLVTLSRHGVLLEEIRTSGIATGADMTGFPTGKDFVNQNSLVFATVLSGAGFQTPEQLGEQAGEQRVSEAETILGAATGAATGGAQQLTGPQSERLAGVAERPPLIQNLQQTAFQKGIGGQDAERVGKIEERSTQAFDTLTQTQRIKIGIESGGFKTGAFGDARLFLAEVFAFANITDETGLLGDAATAENLDAAAKTLAVDQAKKLSRVTNMSLSLIIDTVPKLTRTPQGNLIIAEVMERQAKRDIEIARLADSYIRDFGTLRPKDGKSFNEAVADLHTNDPIIDDDLEKRMVDAAKGAKTSFTHFRDFKTLDAPNPIPQGLPPGSIKRGDKADGSEVWETPDGILVVVKKQ